MDHQTVQCGLISEELEEFYRNDFYRTMTGIWTSISCRAHDQARNCR